MFSAELQHDMALLIADGEGWRIAQHDALLDAACSLVDAGHTPADVAASAAATFELDEEDERHIASVLRQHLRDHDDYDGELEPPCFLADLES